MTMDSGRMRHSKSNNIRIFSVILQIAGAMHIYLYQAFMFSTDRLFIA